MTEPTTQHHVLVITDEGHGQRFAIECPGVSDFCRAWAECFEKGCPVRRDHIPASPTGPGCPEDCTVHGEDNEGDELEAHGQRHQYIYSVGGWCTPTVDCWLVGYGEIGDAATNLQLAGAPGRYPVRHGLENDEFLTLSLLETAEAAK
jgi:hypothetical protein